MLRLSKPSLAIIALALLAAAYGLMSADSESANSVAVVSTPERPGKEMQAAKPTSDQGPADLLSSRIDALASRVSAEHPAGELFASSLPPPPPVAPRSARSAPAAPVFPYTYMGSLEDGDGRTVYLSGNNDRVVLARVNQTLDGVFHVDHVDARQITVTYLPLKRTQTISITKSE